MSEARSLRSTLWIFVVGEVAATFAHAAFFAALGRAGRGDAVGLLMMPGGAFSILGGLVLLYFVASLERAAWSITQKRGSGAALVVLGALSCILGVRVFTEAALLLRARRAVVDAGADDKLAVRVTALVFVRALVQLLGAIPAVQLADTFSHGQEDALDWVAVSAAPTISLALALVVARMLTHALAQRFGAPALDGMGSAGSVAVPTTPRS